MRSAAAGRGRTARRGDRRGLAATGRRRADRLHECRPAGAGSIGNRRRRGGADRRTSDRRSWASRPGLVGHPARADHDVGRREPGRSSGRPDVNVGLVVAGHRCGGRRRRVPADQRGQSGPQVAQRRTGRWRQAGGHPGRGRATGNSDRSRTQRHAGPRRGRRGDLAARAGGGRPRPAAARRQPVARARQADRRLARRPAARTPGWPPTTGRAA